MLLRADSRTAWSKETVFGALVSSTLRPLVVSVCRPFAMPRRPPRAWKAARDLGFSNLLSWPGEKAKGLFSTRKSSSVPGSGRSAWESSSLKLAVRLVAVGVRKGFDVADVIVSEELRARGRVSTARSEDDDGSFSATMMEGDVCGDSCEWEESCTD